ncbi:class I SAM-dependent methyltransferase [Candidatus Woesearchaeota archaeon]|nr:class I SAM-dependent methyltransferase [Candidatus Woesearchaeota archaeon]
MLENYFKYLYNDVVSASREKFMQMLDGPVDSLLDLGCWDGANTIRYGKKAHAKKLFGIEIEETKAKIASNKWIKVKLSNLNDRFPFKDNSMDVVAANHVIEHLTQTELFISEIYRVLKKNGYAVIATPNLASWHNVFALTFGIQPFSGPHVRTSNHDIKSISEMDDYKVKNLLKSTEKGKDYLRHLVVMTYKELIKNLRKAGFVIEKSYGFGYYPLPSLLANLFAKIDIRHSHYVVVRVRKR